VRRACIRTVMDFPRTWRAVGKRRKDKKLDTRKRLDQGRTKQTQTIDVQKRKASVAADGSSSVISHAQLTHPGKAQWILRSMYYRRHTAAGRPNKPNESHQRCLAMRRAASEWFRQRCVFSTAAARVDCRMTGSSLGVVRKAPPVLGLPFSSVDHLVQIRMHMKIAMISDSCVIEKQPEDRGLCPFAAAAFDIRLHGIRYILTAGMEISVIRSVTLRP